MRYFKVILLAIAVSCAFAGSLIFTACNKVTCSNIVCLNGGTCSNGKCTCPAGYTGIFCGSRAMSAVSYQNNTFTPISITVNGATQTIPVGGSVFFTDTIGAVALGTATTSGTASELGISTAGGAIGLTINWAINNNFPATDTLRVPLDVGSTYFYLFMTNNGSKDIIDYYVNVNFSYGSFYQDVTMPHNSGPWGMGYYLAYSSSNVQTQSSDNKVVWKAVTLPFTTNQSFTVTVP